MLRFMLIVLASVLLSACAHNGGGALARGISPRELGPGAVIHYVRISSGLPDEEVMRVLRRRAERFREVPGLVQKIYGRDAETGEICGIYIFESQSALDAFGRSELARATRDAYQIESARIERYDVLFTLHPGVRAE